MELTAGYWAGLFSVIAAIIAISSYAGRKVGSAADFALGGRSAGVLMVMGTIIGTIVGAASTVGTAQMAFKTGISAWWFCIGSGLALVIMGLLYSGPLYASGKSTVSQFLTSAYDGRTGMITGIFSVTGIFFSAASTLLVLMPMLGNSFYLDIRQSAVLTFVLIIFYVLFGGVKATGLVGIFKTGLLFIVLGAVFFTAWRSSGGLALFAGYSYYPWFSLFARGFWVDIAAGASTVVGVMTTQTYIQAMCSAKDAKKSRDGMLLSGFLTAVSAIPAIHVGFFMHTKHPDIAPIDALPLFIMTYLPDWFAGVSIGMLIIASLGTMAGLVLGMSTIVSADIFGVFFSNIYRKSTLLVTRATVLLLILVLILFTLANLDAMVLDWTILSMCLRGAGVFVPFIMAIYAPGRFDVRFAALAVGSGSLVALAWRIFFPGLFSPLYPGMLISCLFMFLGYKKPQHNT